jgi:hypothetical protein
MAGPALAVTITVANNTALSKSAHNTLPRLGAE